RTATSVKSNNICTADLSRPRAPEVTLTPSAMVFSFYSMYAVTDALTHAPSCSGLSAHTDPARQASPRAGRPETRGRATRKVAPLAPPPPALPAPPATYGRRLAAARPGARQLPAPHRRRSRAWRENQPGIHVRAAPAVRPRRGMRRVRHWSTR